MITRKHLPRRAFLKGLGTAIALPWLDSMTPAFAASRLDGKPPVRVAFAYVPNSAPLNARLAMHRVVSVVKSMAGGLTLGILMPQHDMVGWTKIATLRRLSSSNTAENDGSPSGFPA